MHWQIMMAHKRRLFWSLVNSWILMKWIVATSKGDIYRLWILRWCDRRLYIFLPVGCWYCVLLIYLLILFCWGFSAILLSHELYTCIMWYHDGMTMQLPQHSQLLYVSGFSYLPICVTVNNYSKLCSIVTCIIYYVLSFILQFSW